MNEYILELPNGFGLADDEGRARIILNNGEAYDLEDGSKEKELILKKGEYIGSKKIKRTSKRSRGGNKNEIQKPEKKERTKVVRRRRHNRAPERTGYLF